MKIAVRARLRGLQKRASAARRRLRRSGPPVLVYQMGKVGSSTVVASLRESDPSLEVLHVHLLEDLDALEAQARATYPDPSETVKQIEWGRRLRERIRRSPDTQWCVITLVRDPVQRNVSAFFENLTEVIPDAYERRARGDLTAAELLDAFLERYDHHAPLSWFQAQLQPVFDVDVFATPFDPDRGWALYESPRARVLLVRLEDLTGTGERAIREFLGLEVFRLRTANTGHDKPYAAMYAEFGREVGLPADYLDRMYDSAVARHFYSDAEIDAQRRRWTKVDG